MIAEDQDIQRTAGNRFEPFTLPLGKSEYVFADLSVTLKNDGGRFTVSTRLKDDPLADGRFGGPEIPTSFSWPVREDKQLIFKPVLPDLPVFIKPLVPMYLPAKETQTIYIDLPLFIRLEWSDKNKNPLLDQQTTVFQKTWFGIFNDGELCYWHKTNFDLKPRKPGNPETHAIVPITITNSFDEALLIDKICHRVINCTLFTQAGLLFTDPTKINYSGPTHSSSISYSGKPPQQWPDAVPIAQPRHKLSTNIVARTFATFKHINVFMR